MEIEDYVSLQVAKLLKEKGFNEICNAAYSIEDENINPLFYGTFQNNGDGYVACHIAAPTLYEAQKWLRDKYGIAVNIMNCITPSIEERILWHYEINKIKTCKSIKDKHLGRKGFSSYEEALDAGILEALKMI